MVYHSCTAFVELGDYALPEGTWGVSAEPVYLDCMSIVVTKHVGSSRHKAGCGGLRFLCA